MARACLTASADRVVAIHPVLTALAIVRPAGCLSCPTGPRSGQRRTSCSRDGLPFQAHLFSKVRRIATKNLAARRASMYKTNLQQTDSPLEVE